MKEAILIVEHNRPHYLWLCLHALSKVYGLARYDVFADIDGPYQGEFVLIAKAFQWCQFYRRPDWSGSCRKQFMRALARVFQKGYEGVIYFEGDVLLRRDSLNYIAQAPKDQCFTSLQSHCPYYLRKPDDAQNTYQGYMSLGNWIDRSHFDALADFVNHERYVGQILWERFTGHHDMNSHDLAFCFFCAMTGARTRAAPINYSFHFGVCGMGTQDWQVEQQIFSGSMSQWLGNLLRVRETQASPAFVPNQFDYA